MKTSKVLQDCLALSSGTLSYLIDCREYTVIEKVQSDFVLWVANCSNTFNNWQEAWLSFWEASK